MGQVLGQVIAVRDLPERDGKSAFSVSVEGVSLLATDGQEKPVRGAMIKAAFNCHWPRREGSGSKRPILFLGPWESL